MALHTKKNQISQPMLPSSSWSTRMIITLLPLFLLPIKALNCCRRYIFKEMTWAEGKIWTYTLIVVRCRRIFCFLPVPRACIWCCCVHGIRYLNCVRRLVCALLQQYHCCLLIVVERLTLTRLTATIILMRDALRARRCVRVWLLSWKSKVPPWS